MRSFVFLTLLACGGDPAGLADQDFIEFENWGNGIEGFGAVLPGTGDTDTDDTNSGFTDYDGNYFGNYTFTISNAGQTCTFTNVGLLIAIQNGVIDGSGQPGETTCDLGSGSVVYTARLSFDGTIASDSSAVGMFFEDNISFFEGDWTGFATLTDPIQVSGTFNQNVDTVNPGGLVSVSGSFFAEQ